MTHSSQCLDCSVGANCFQPPGWTCTSVRRWVIVEKAERNVDQESDWSLTRTRTPGKGMKQSGGDCCKRTMKWEKKGGDWYALWVKKNKPLRKRGQPLRIPGASPTEHGKITGKKIMHRRCSIYHLTMQLSCTLEGEKKVKRCFCRLNNK